MHVITVVYQYFEPSKMIPHPKLDLRVFSIASFFIMSYTWKHHIPLQLKILNKQKEVHITCFAFCLMFAEVGCG